MTIQDILQKKGEGVLLVRPTETVLTVVRLMHERGLSSAIVEDDHLRPHAIFTERDFTQATAHHGAAALNLSVGSLARAPMIICKPDESLEVALAIMTRNNVRHLPVMQEGTLLGVVTIVDLVRRRLMDKEFEAQVLLDLSRRHA